jgi:hypothetical protein
MTDAWCQRVEAEWRLPVLRYVHRLTGDSSFAERVAREVFDHLAATSGLEAQSISARSPGAWLFERAAKIVRKDERATTNDGRDESIGGARAALGRLAVREREALMMREAGFSYEEIARATGIAADMVPDVVVRALRGFQGSYAGGRS